MADEVNQNAINALNQISLSIAQLTKTTNNVFPQTIGVALSATSGAIIPTNYQGFLTVANPLTGVTVKIPYYL